MENSPSQSDGAQRFYAERFQHKELFGREDILREIDRLLLMGDAPCGWLLVRSTPGMGKSALLSRWLGPLNAPRWPHHFIRRGVESFDQPLRITCSLAEQVEALYQELRDPDATPALRLVELLRRVSRRHHDSAWCWSAMGSMRSQPSEAATRCWPSCRSLCRPECSYSAPHALTTPTWR